jgi:uncharacterized membrane protein
MSTNDTRRTISKSAFVVGAVVALAHLTAAIGFGMAARKWVSGAAIGAVLVVIAAGHLLIPGHGLRGDGRVSAREVGHLALAVGLGLPVGVLMGLVFPWLRWGVLPAVAILAVVAVGRFSGSAAAKALRLAAFGVAAGTAFLLTDEGGSAGAGTSLSDRIQFVLSFGVFAVLAGVIVHALVNRPGSIRPDEQVTSD